MVNSHLKIQQTKGIAVLEGLQAAPRHQPGSRSGRPSTAGDPGAERRRGGRSGESGRGKAGAWATAPPSGLKEERRSPS